MCMHIHTYHVHILQLFQIWVAHLFRDHLGHGLHECMYTVLQCVAVCCRVLQSVAVLKMSRELAFKKVYLAYTRGTLLHMTRAPPLPTHSSRLPL